MPLSLPSRALLFQPIQVASSGENTCPIDYDHSVHSNSSTLTTKQTFYDIHIMLRLDHCVSHLHLMNRHFSKSLL